MSNQFKGKVALVTGAAGGIGRATAMAFAAKGASVVVSDYVNGEETVQLIKKAGGDAIFIQADVSDPTAVKNLMDKIESHYGHLDCAHNNAGFIGKVSAIADCTMEDFEKMVNVNFKGVFLCMKYEVPLMLKNGGGAIVNTASAAGLVGVAGIGGYCGTKWGVIGLTKAAAVDYAQLGIRVNAVCPGSIRTNMLLGMFDFNEDDPGFKQNTQIDHPVGRMGKPEEIASAVVYLCSHEASFVTGHAMAVDGGYSAH